MNLLNATHGINYHSFVCFIQNKSFLLKNATAHDNIDRAVCYSGTHEQKSSMEEFSLNK